MPDNDQPNQGTPAPAAPLVPDLAPPPAAPRAPDSVTLTRRELDQQVERAVAAAVEAVQSKAMPNDEKPAFTAEDFAKIKASADEALAVAKAATEQSTKLKEESDKQIAELKARAEAAEAKAEEEKKARRRAKDKVVEANLRKAAAKAGIDDEDYALVLYAREASARVNKKDAEGNPAPEPPPSPEEFFAHVAKTKPGLLRVAPPAPPANTSPAGADPGASASPPPPAAGGAAKPNEESVEDMDEREFAARTRGKYGFNPTVAI